VGIERQIRQLGIVLSICFLLTAAGLGYWSLIRAPELVGRAYNPRWIEAERRVRRGDILDRAGRPLVRSEPGPLGTWQRVYLVPEAAPVVGYYAINHGTGGIEHAYDAQIRGARTLSPIDRLRADLLHLHPAGITVTLTIDVDVQQAASRALGEQMGAVVVLDVQDGDILAMVSNPTFDPNSLEVDWPLLNRSRDKPMLNRATQGLYPPGLVFETITLAATIAEGVAQPTTAFTDELGVLLSVEPPISCPSSPPRKQFTLAEAYLWPCNVLFARLGLELGGAPGSGQAARPPPGGVARAVVRKGRVEQVDRRAHGHGPGRSAGHPAGDGPGDGDPGQRWPAARAAAGALGGRGGRPAGRGAQPGAARGRGPAGPGHPGPGLCCRAAGRSLV
jgi:peptidoglycan glycosyltransferase